MKVHKLKLGLNKTNTYIIEKEISKNTQNKQKNKCLMIDCPSDIEKDIGKINEILENKELIGIIYTHNHFDHIGGGYLFNVPQFMNEKDIENLDEQIELGKTYNHPVTKIPKVKPIEKISQEILGVFNFKIIETPGHTQGGISIYFEKEKILFSGDTLFRGVHGRCDFKYSNINDMKNSLKKLLKLPNDTIIYPGHGVNSKIENELECFKEILEK